MQEIPPAILFNLPIVRQRKIRFKKSINCQGRTEGCDMMGCLIIRIPEIMWCARWNNNTIPGPENDRPAIDPKMQLTGDHFIRTFLFWMNVYGFTHIRLWIKTFYIQQLAVGLMGCFSEDHNLACQGIMNAVILSDHTMALFTLSEGGILPHPDCLVM